MTNWKTSVAGSLSALIATVGPLSAYFASTNNPKAAAWGAGLTCAGAIARVWVGLIQNDAAPAPAPKSTETFQYPDK